MNKITTSFLPVLFLGVLGATLDTPPVKHQPPVVTSAPQGLEKARQAAFDLVFPNRAAGNGVLVSRTKAKDGRYRYRVLTANHIIDDIQLAISREAKVDRTMVMTFQPKFWGAPLQIYTQLEKIDWASPTRDWASFTFLSEQKLQCVEVASAKELQAIKPWDNIYIAGGYGAENTIQFRKGNISATHNIEVDRTKQIISSWPWDRHPYSFMRISTPIWFGDSGGPIFSENGKMIGMINGMIYRGIYHTCVALKAPIILDIVKTDKDFFKVEE